MALLRGLDDVSHCTGASSCGSFHSDQMLWSTKETASYVQKYASDQDAFFKDYTEAHIRMAHVDCLSCGKGSHTMHKRCHGKYGK